MIGKNNNTKLNMSNSKKCYSKSARRKRLIKKAICLVMSFVMFSISTGIFSFWDLLGLSGPGGAVKAAGSHSPKYGVNDITTDDTITIDDVSRPYYKISSKSTLIWYTQAYYDYPGNHSTDAIRIDLGTGETGGSFDGFESIGNDDDIFNGVIIFGQTSQRTFNLDVPFFGTVYDSVRVIKETGSGNEAGRSLMNLGAPIQIVEDLDEEESEIESPSEEIGIPEDSEELSEEIINPEDSEESSEEIINPEDSEETSEEIINPEDSEETSEEIVNPDDSEESSEGINNPENSENNTGDQTEKNENENNEELNGGEGDVTAPINNSASNASNNIAGSASGRPGEATYVEEEPANNEIEGEEVSDDDAASDDSEGEEGTSEEGTSEEGTSEEGTSEEGTSEEGTSEEGTSEEGTSEEGTSEEGTSEEGTSEETTSEDTSSEKTTSEEIVSEEIVSEETTSEESSKGILGKAKRILGANPNETAITYEMAEVTITRVSDGIDEPLFARRVVHDEDSTGVEWYVTVEHYTESGNNYAWPFAGFIGLMDEESIINLTAINNAIYGNLKADIIRNSGDVGLLCCEMADAAKLTATYDGTNTSFDILTQSGNAGGLVGSMGVGATLDVTVNSNPQSQNDQISTVSGYAGAIVGENIGGSVSLNTLYILNQNISGTDGVGSIYGYYRPALSNNQITIDVKDYSINTVISGTGAVGSLYGVLENAETNSTEDIITITSTGNVNKSIAVVNDTTSLENYGGLIGLYRAYETTDTLNISKITTTMTNNSTATNYGGFIGCIDGDSYANFENVTLSNASGIGEAYFGGLTASAEFGYVYAKSITIGSSEIEGFKGGGLVGKLGNGVLGMTGSIDVTNAKPTGAADNGQLVGTRNDALIYAENWTYTPSSVEIDNIGSWGDVLIIDGTKLKKNSTDAYNVFSESNHIITIGTVSPSAIANEADFAKVSLLFQINPSNNSFLVGTQLAESVGLTFTNDITLTGTGLRGITRDNGSSRIKYSGTVTGGNNKIVLDIKNVGQNSGNDRPVYRHVYNGLFGVAKNVIVNNLNLDGSIKAKSVIEIYAGSLAAYSDGTFAASGCNTLSTLGITMTKGDNNYYAGRFVGDSGTVNNKFSGMNTVTISSCIFDGNITGTGDSYVGGVFGKLSADSSKTPTWTFSNVKLKGTVKGVKSVGGLVAISYGLGKATIKIGNSTSDVVADGDFIVEGNSKDSMGGLLGYSWSLTDVEIDDFKVSGNPTVKQNSTGGVAGLVYRATGHWTVNKLYLGYKDNNNVTHAIKMLAGTAGSVGMIVNKGKNGNDGIYLELPYGYDYKLTFATGSGFKSGAVFDEICAYSSDGDSSIMNNGQAIVSISTEGLKMETTAEDSLSYRNQTTQGTAKNPNTRYYYNLDKIDKDNTLSLDADKLMRWGVNQYACENIKSYFPDPFSGIIPAGSYDMKGYSWYPVSVGTALTLNGTFKFYNKEFTECEDVKSTDNKWLPNDTGSINQHYMMQNGLLYNVTNNLTIKNVTLQGTIGAVDTSGTGALVYGTISGSSSAQSDITVIDSTSGSITLDGIKVWNFQGTGGVSSNYAPLLINKTNSFVTLNISNVSTTGYSAAAVAATSLIGKAGQTSISEGVITKDTYVTVTFSNIKLDARKTEGTPVLSNHGYNTTKSIFTRATLLESMVNESGTYTYTYNDDWNNNNHKVTYGKEVGYDSTSTTTQYPGEEQWYYRTATTENQRATQYSSAPTGATPTDSFSDFLPYVCTVSTAAEISGGTGTFYQLKVNHQPSEVIEGCGTYNDPYIIKTGSDLEKISRWIGGNDLDNATINYLLNDTWCDNKSEHTTKTGFTENTTPSIDTIRKYLAGAYYEIDPSGGNSITIESSNFTGLGTKDSGYRFRGVIVGGDNITITNKTPYPLIAYSDGSVVKNLTINVDSSGLYSNNNTYKQKIVVRGQNVAYDSYTMPTTGGDVNKPNAYGAVIGQIVGGDNIIDNVQLDLTNLKIYLENYSQYAPVGGYVGVIINGGLVFRNMTGSISGLTNNANIIAKSDSNLTTITNLLDSDNFTWLYVNPIIGRVINGYAVTESDEYRPREANVTMKNSTGSHTIVKNYSITDIKSAMIKDNNNNFILSDSEKLDVTSSNAINISNSQSFYLMSLMINCGLSIQRLVDKSDIDTTNILGYYDSYYTLHYGNYNEVGEATSTDYSTYAVNDINYASIASTDYVTKKVKYVPYLVKNYSKPYTATISGATPSSQTVYYAKTIGNIYKADGKSIKNFTIELTGDTGYTYYLPDGFRGIGNNIKDDDNLRLNITSFEGNGLTIDQNSSYYYYAKENQLHDAADVYKNAATEITGLGLFNCLNTNCSFSNFILTGSVKCDAISRQKDTTNSVNSGEHIFYKSGWTNQNRHLSAGMLLATVKSGCYPTIDSVALQNVSVKGVRYTGGLIGNVPNTNKQVLSVTNTLSLSSYGITVHGAGTTGGMIGRSQQGSVTVDNNNATYSIVEVVSDCSEQSETTKDYNYGVGGFIGICRGDGAAYNINISNVIVGTKEQSSVTEVKCPDAEINTGGMIGILNNAKSSISNCKIYNQSVSSQYTAGGLVGYVATLKNKQAIAESSITGIIIECKEGLNGEIKSTNRFAGGFIGACKYDSCNIKITDGKVKGYNISGPDYVGGIVGLWSHVTEDGSDHCKKDTRIITNNVSVENCNIRGSSDNSYVGGLIGYLNVNVSGFNYNRDYYGYNILENNVTIIGINKGCICGGTGNTSYNVIKLVGFSRQEALGEGETSSMIQETVGSGGYGTGGYVVFADYLGDSIKENPETGKKYYSTTFSNIHNDNNVAITYKDEGGNYVNYPYVTSTTPTIIGESCKVNNTLITGEGFVTGDGVSSSAFGDILKDMTNSAPGYYDKAKSNIKTAPGYITNFDTAKSALSSHLSTFQIEMGPKAVSDIDFPLLVVDDVTDANTTAIVNNYLRMLTNTDYDFNMKDDDVCKVKLSKCTFSADGSILNIDDSSSCLGMNTLYFNMRANDTDTKAETAQFTLIDVQFKNPAEPSEIAYHLYAPVYVRKLLQYDFNIRLESGTEFVPTSPIAENTLLENLGVPVTMEFQYKYSRNTSEWQKAVDGGDNLLTNYDKKLLFGNSSIEKTVAGNTVMAGFESENAIYDCMTKMVLIDSNNSGKAYYLDSLTSASFTKQGSTNNWLLDLQKFKSIESNVFKPQTFNSMMTITAVPDVNGTFVRTDECLGDPTVEDNSGGTYNGKQFRLKTNEDDTDYPNAQKYKIVVSNADSISEHYFLTIYTTADYSSNNIPVYHYTITSQDTLGSIPYPSRVETRQAAHLVTGELYSNSMTLTLEKDEMDMLNAVHKNGEDYQLQARLKATVEVAQDAKTIVTGYLQTIDTIEIYQSFLATLNMKQGQTSSRGIKALKAAEYYGTEPYKINGHVVENIPTPTANANYVEFKNNENLRGRLAQGMVEITANISLVFAYDDIVGNASEGVPNQFYPGPVEGVGTTLIASSNIASNSNQTANSKVIKEIEDSEHLHYYLSSETVELIYSAYPDEELGQFGQLGINANDLEQNPVPITSLAAYDISRFQSSALEAEYLKIEVEMLTIDNSYATDQTLNISDYMTNFAFVTNTAATSVDKSNPKKWVFVYPKTAFTKESQTYQIPINYSIYTGKTAEFEDSNRKYSNYEVKVTVSMQDEDREDIPNSSAPDYIKYTNARIYTGKVNPNKAEPSP